MNRGCFDVRIDTPHDQIDRQRPSERVPVGIACRDPDADDGPPDLPGAVGRHLDVSADLRVGIFEVGLRGTVYLVVTDRRPNSRLVTNAHGA